jgi:hypothetical protein
MMIIGNVLKAAQTEADRSFDFNSTKYENLDIKKNQANFPGCPPPPHNKKNDKMCLLCGKGGGGPPKTLPTNRKFG